MMMEASGWCVGALALARSRSEAVGPALPVGRAYGPAGVLLDHEQVDYRSGHSKYIADLTSLSPPLPTANKGRALQTRVLVWLGRGDECNISRVRSRSISHYRASRSRRLPCTCLCSPIPARPAQWGRGFGAWGWIWHPPFDPPRLAPQADVCVANGYDRRSSSRARQSRDRRVRVAVKSNKTHYSHFPWCLFARLLLAERP